jgi:hypothetical protein
MTGDKLGSRQATGDPKREDRQASLPAQRIHNQDDEHAASSSGGSIVPLERPQQAEREPLGSGTGSDDDDPGPRAA